MSKYLTKTAAPSMIGKSKLISLRTKWTQFVKISEVQKLKYVHHQFEIKSGFSKYKMQTNLGEYLQSYSWF